MLDLGLDLGSGGLPVEFEPRLPVGVDFHGAYVGGEHLPIGVAGLKVGADDLGCGIRGCAALRTRLGGQLSLRG